MAAPPPLRTSVRAMPRAAWILFAGTFVNRFGSFVSVFLILYLRNRGYSISAAGAAVGAYGVGGISAAAIGGLLADRLGRRGSIALSMFSSAATMLALSQARSLWLIVALTALAGLTSEAYRPASSALLADLLPTEQRVAGFVLYRFAINAGFAAGPAVAGLIATHTSFFWLFAGDAITSVVYGIVALAALPTGVRSSRSEERRGEATRAVLADTRFVLFLLSSVAIAFVYFQTSATLPLAVRHEGLSTAAYGFLISLNGIVIVFLELPLTAVTQRFAAPPVIALGVLLTGAGFALTALAHALPFFVVTVVIWTLGEIVSAPIASAYVADLSPERLRGRYQGAFGLTWGAGSILGPALGSLLFAVSPGWLWATCGMLGVVSAGLVLAGPSRRARPGLVVPEPGAPITEVPETC